MVKENLIFSRMHIGFLRKGAKYHVARWLSAILVVLALLIFWAQSILTPYIDDDFSYSASLQTTENDYDAVTERYGSDHYILSNFSIDRLDDTTTNKALLRSTFGVHQPETQTTQTTTQQFTASPTSGQLLSVHSSQPVYIFAPRGIARGASFVSWQQAYNTTATMQYADRELLLGLPVYRYTAQFANNGYVIANQAHSLQTAQQLTGTNTSGQASEYRPQITIWIEPTTGWLVKYREDTTRYAYDTVAGKQGVPISHISSNFTDATVKQQVDYTRQLKYRLDFGLQAAPSVLIVVLLTILLFKVIRYLQIQYLPVELMATAILVADLANLFGWLLHIRPLIVLGFGTTALNPLASISFMAIVLGTLSLCRRKTNRLVIVLGTLVITLGIFNVLHTAHLINFDISGVPLHNIITDSALSASSHLSLFGSLTIMILGGSLIIATTATNATTLYPAKIFAGVATTLGAIGLLAKLLLLDEVFVVPEIATLSVAGSIMVLLVGVCLLQTILSYCPRSIDNEALPANKPKLSGQQWRPLLHALRSPALATVPLIILGVLAQLQQTDIKQQLQATFDKQVATLQTAITDKVSIYTNTLVGAKALYAASTSVERGEWHNYIADLDISHTYPGIQAVGFVSAINNDQLASTTQQLRSHGFPSFTVFPVRNQPTYDYLLYIEPFNQTSVQLVGYDLASIPTLDNAMDIAKRSGQPVLSGKTNSFHNSDKNSHSSFSLIVPVYYNGRPTNTATERESALQGYIYAPLNGTSFFESITRSQVSLKVYDGFSKTDRTLLYDQPVTDSVELNGANVRLAKTNTVHIKNHPWTIVYTADVGFELSNADERGPSLILVGGSSVYLVCLMAVLAYRVLRRQVITQHAHNSKRNMSDS
jgi:CHASE1-domain containing sensor protein